MPQPIDFDAENRRIALGLPATGTNARALPSSQPSVPLAAARANLMAQLLRQKPGTPQQETA